MDKILFSIKIIILTGLLILACVMDNKVPEKLPKTGDKLLYIMVENYSVGKIDNTIAIKPENEAAVTEDIFRIFENKEQVKSEETVSPQYGVTFLYNLDPEQSKVREEFLESDRFDLAVNKDYIILTDKKTRETFTVKGEDYNKLILDMKISI